METNSGAVEPNIIIESSASTGDELQKVGSLELYPSSQKLECSNKRNHGHLKGNYNSLLSGDEHFPKLSLINGTINKMAAEQMQVKLTEYNLNASGTKEVLRKRLKNYCKRQRMAQCNILDEDERTKYDYLVVIDFEATCSETNENFVHEIIEFPAVVVDVKNQTISSIFQRYCKPRVNPILTEFCTQLTGISQSKVDEAQDFTEVFKEFEEWLSSHNLLNEHQSAIVTDGPCDMGGFLKTQLRLSGIKYPQWAKQWINLRKVYSTFYSAKCVNIQRMLDGLGLKFQGRPHCGLDDATNIAAIVVQLLQDGCNLRVNEHHHDDANTQDNVDPSKASGDSNIPTSLSKQQEEQSNSDIGQECTVQILSI